MAKKKKSVVLWESGLGVGVGDSRGRAGRWLVLQYQTGDWTTGAQWATRHSSSCSHRTHGAHFRSLCSCSDQVAG